MRVSGTASRSSTGSSDSPRPGARAGAYVDAADVPALEARLASLRATRAWG